MQGWQESELARRVKELEAEVAQLRSVVATQAAQLAMVESRKLESFATFSEELAAFRRRRGAKE